MFITGTRPELHEVLCKSLGSRNVYYQPPESIRMQYPAIVYSRNDTENIFADDSVYMQAHEYRVVVIDENPDSEIVEAVSKLPMCRFNRHYKQENLNHDVFTLYF